MSRPLILSENLQVRLPEGTKARMRQYVPPEESVAGFWRVRMLNWLANMQGDAGRREGDDG